MSAPTSLSAEILGELTSKVTWANNDFARDYPGERGARQPVHTVYGGAHLFKAGTPQKLGQLALAQMEQFAPDATTFARAHGLAERYAGDIYARVRDKLRREAVEDFRIDFEDGYGIRANSEEDGHAVGAAQELAKAARAGLTPPFCGIRVKSLGSELLARSLRTLDLFVTTLVKDLGRVPDNFVVTLPKITRVEHVAALAKALAALEKALGLRTDTLKLEVMVETTQNMFDRQGRFVLPLLLEAAAGRCVAAHFGTYDYTAACNITAQYQAMGHPSCDLARQLMTLAYAGTGLWLSDGATTTMPIVKHRAKDGARLTAAQEQENRAIVHAAWKLHFDNIHGSLRLGFYQGWDLHPGQLPTRYAATYSFFLDGLADASARLRNFIDKAAQATTVGQVFDDAATGQGLLNFFLRGVNCGALTEEEALVTGVTLDELRGRSFVKIVEKRRAP